MVAKILSFLALVTVTVAGGDGHGKKACLIQFDGRVPVAASPASFDAPTSLYNPSYVIGKNLTWSKILQFPTWPAVPVSLFDQKTHTKALEVTLSDKSIFAPGPDNVQVGFRRAELLPASNSGSDNSTIGVKTLHFSLRKDNQRPLNISHEYQLVFLESADYSTNQFALKTGTIIGASKRQDPSLLVLQSNVRDPKNLFTTPFKKDVWHNFGLVLDFKKNTTQVLYSQNNAPLKAVTKALPNDISGQGQFHFGLLKKPTGEGLTDITKQGYQPKNINEGVVYGGIFEENSEGGCVSWKP